MSRQPFVILGTQWASMPPALRPRLDHVALIDPAAAYDWDRHVHSGHEVIIPLSGRYRCQVGDAALMAGPGEAIVIGPGDVHHDLVRPPLRYIGVGFALRAPLLAPDADPRLRVVRDEALADNAHRLIAADQAGGRGARALAASVLEELAWRLIRALPEAALARPLREAEDDRRFLERLRALFAERLARPTGAAGLAAAMGMGERALTRRCRALLGAPPVKAFTDHRLDHAAALIAQTGMPVARVAQQLGFASPFHFSRAFKRRHGRPPSRAG